jgi:hypothetical protein
VPRIWLRWTVPPLPHTSAWRGACQRQLCLYCTTPVTADAFCKTPGSSVKCLAYSFLWMEWRAVPIFVMQYVPWISRRFCRPMYVSHFIFRWSETVSELRPPTDPLFFSLICEYGALVEWYWQGETEELGEKPVSVPLYPPQIPLMDSPGREPGPPLLEASD